MNKISKTLRPVVDQYKDQILILQKQQDDLLAELESKIYIEGKEYPIYLRDWIWDYIFNYDSIVDVEYAASNIFEEDEL